MNVYFQPAIATAECWVKVVPRLQMQQKSSKGSNSAHLVAPRFSRQSLLGHGYSQFLLRYRPATKVLQPGHAIKKLSRGKSDWTL